jgi:ABC-type multidrug transport system fused ATPase/permease subunit
LLKQSSGEIYIDNNNINYDFLLRNLSLISQNPFFANASIKDNLCFGIDSDKINLEKVNEVLKIVELFDFVNEMKNKLDTIIGERGSIFSGGQLQRLGIARSLYSNPDLLILDESTNALDKDTQRKIINNLFLNYKNKTIIIISHDHDILSECNKIYKIENKKIQLI